MDVATLLLILGISGGLTLLSFKGRKPGWVMIGIFASMVAVIGTLALLNDGNLTTNCGTCVGGTYTMAAANGNFVSDFNAISVGVIAIPVSEFVASIRRLFKV